MNMFINPFLDSPISIFLFLRSPSAKGSLGTFAGKDAKGKWICNVIRKLVMILESIMNNAFPIDNTFFNPYLAFLHLSSKYQFAKYSPTSSLLINKIPDIYST